MNANAPTGSPRASELASLADLLLASLDALAKAEAIDRACRLAGSAYMTLRHSEPRQAARFNGFLHRWASATEPQAPQPGAGRREDGSLPQPSDGTARSEGQGMP